MLAIGRHCAFASGYYVALLIEPMLHLAQGHHGRPSQKELAALWSSELIGAVRGERIARALELFWDGHPDDRAHLPIP